MATSDRDRLLGEFMEAGRRLSAAVVRFHSQVAEQEGLGASDLKALDVLREHGELTPHELGEQLGMAPASITGLATRLENRGLVSRTQRADDRRRVSIAITPQASVRFQEPFDRLGAELTAALTDFTEDELRLITSALTRLAEAQMAAATRLSGNLHA